MAFTLTDLSALRAAPFDDLIDVRSPAEFAEDHLPGAINLPVLSNAERARVGTIYKQQSPFLARKIGAALVLQNTATHIAETLADRDGGWRPMVYCWRGGQRSGTFGWLLGQIGWRTETLTGGYQSFRRAVVSVLYDQPVAHRFVLLSGMTCTAKTDLLALLRARGHQTIDLEGLARHRGSVFGAMDDVQPSQKWFETGIAMALAGFDPARPVILEAESSKVGDLIVPPSIWKAMTIAPRVEVTAPITARAAYFPHAYADLVADPALFKQRIGALVSLHGHALISDWQALVDQGAFEAVARALMQRHYDPRYAKSSGRFAGTVRQSVEMPDLSEKALDARVGDVERAIEGALSDQPDARPPGADLTDLDTALPE